MIILAPVVGVPYNVVWIIEVFLLQLLLAFTITAFGVMIAVRIKQMQSFMGVMQMIVTPMFFISGALFPAAGLPGWLTVLNRLDPLTYAVDPMRLIVFSHLSISLLAKRALDPGITWFGWHVPTLVEVAIVAAMGLAMLGVAIWEFSATE
jgi:ABC-2 type transport system permease protein